MICYELKMSRHFHQGRGGFESRSAGVQMLLLMFEVQVSGCGGDVTVFRVFLCAEMDDEDCERRRMECLDEMTTLEKQFTDLKEQ